MSWNILCLGWLKPLFQCALSRYLELCIFIYFFSPLKLSFIPFINHHRCSPRSIEKVPVAFFQFWYSHLLINTLRIIILPQHPLLKSCWFFNINYSVSYVSALSRTPENYCATNSFLWISRNFFIMFHP